MDIKEALAQLDPENNDHWTADGAPRVDVVADLVGNKELKRADITNAAPDFHRSTAGQPAAAKEDGPTDADPPEGDAQGTGEDASQEEEADAEEEATEAPETGPVVEEGVGDLQAETTTPPQPEEPTKELTPLERIEAEAAEKEREMLAAQSEAEQAKARADNLADEVNALNRKADNLRKHDPNHDTAGIRAYIDQQNKNRLDRARGLRRFIETTGVHPADVTKAVDPRAPIDQAMHQRKPARGSQRPDLPKRVR